MFLFRFIWSIVSGLVRVGLIVLIGLCVLNSTSSAVGDLDKVTKNERFWKVAEAVGAEARYQIAGAWTELSKYQIVIVKHER